MSLSFSRRRFLGGITTAGISCYLGLPDAFATPTVSAGSVDEEKLFDWSDWEKYRRNVQHPNLTLKKDDLACAHENRKRYPWAKKYFERIEFKATRHINLISEEFLARMIEETTPGDPLWTPCPACRDQQRPYHPHGLWTWTIEDPGVLKCDVCGTIFPNSQYPEDIVLKTKWGKSQSISFCGGHTFPVFGYKDGRPSFTANIRARKVQWMANLCSVLAEAFALTGNTDYAFKAKDILLRFAHCYPNWLVHVGYGEYADMDPRIASLHIGGLPEPEICASPNTPDKALWTGFWSAGRASGVGLESDFIRKVAKAYDLTCSDAMAQGSSIYSDDEKRKIERDLLLESTILLVADKGINNKSVSNRTAVALVGMCVGHPGLVRFGLEGFNKTVNEWYLRDGTSSETPFYGLMTLGGIWDMAQAARGYSDPGGYRDGDGKRIDSLDLYHDTRFHLVWDAFFKGLQSDMNFPPYADSFRVTGLDPAYVELMVANYPDRKEYLALLKELCGRDLAIDSGGFAGAEKKEETLDETLTLPYDLAKPVGHSSFSFYYRKPGLEKLPSAELSLPDWCPEALRIGHLRTGQNGRESLLMMNASHWGIHHELDSLNLYYWKSGAEVLSDPGYLWDHPRKHQNIRTVAHNTVVIDEKDQVKRERGGDVLFFQSFDHVKAMEMSSNAYTDAKLYRRTSAIIDHGQGRNYVVDFFRVNTGKKQDYVFHCEQDGFKVHNMKLEAVAAANLYDFDKVHTGTGAAVWRATWKSNGNITCTAWSVHQDGEEIFVAQGWGQRDWKNSDVGATIPYVVRRCYGDGDKVFISVFEGHSGNEPFVRNVRVIDKHGVVEVETAIGKDYIMSMKGSGVLQAGTGTKGVRLSGHFAVASVQHQKAAWSVALPEGK